MKNLLAAIVMILAGCSIKPVGQPRCWIVTGVIPHERSGGTQFYLKLKDSGIDRTSYLDTSIFRPYTVGDIVCVQKYDDNGISSVKYIPVP